MVCPNFNEEKKLRKKGYKLVAGLDEAGRGPLAGPVVAAAVCVNFQSNPDYLIFKNVRDSKKLSKNQREEIYKVLTNHKDVKWGIGIVSEKVIDKINILEATKLAMEKSLASLISKPKFKISKQFQIPNFKKIDYLLVDGNFGLGLDILQKSIIKGDQKVFSISAASIIAKVTRDRLMQKYHKKYPEYNFLQNKGYGTKAHFASLNKFGPCKIHRKSFYPVHPVK